MVEDPRKPIIKALRAMLKPVMRFCIRYSISIQDVIESVKLTLIEAAREDLEHKNQEVNVSRLSASTGMHRREVMRIYREEESIEEPQGLIPRIIGQWQQDRRFTTKAGRARVLTVDGPDSEFKRLVRTVSNDLNPGTVLFELERIGAVERTREGLKLTTRAYIPRGNLTEGMALLGQDVADLIEAASGNILSTDEAPNLHATTHYDNIGEHSVEEIREWLNREGSAFHQRARNFLSQFDLDITPSRHSGDGGVRVVIGTFGRIDEQQRK